MFLKFTSSQSKQFVASHSRALENTMKLRLVRFKRKTKSKTFLRRQFLKIPGK